MSRQERRQAERTRSDLTVECFDSNNVFQEGMGRLINVSGIGALIETTLPLLRGQLVWLRLKSDGHPVLDTPAKVTRIGRQGPSATYGVVFMDLSNVNMEWLQGIVEKRAA